jgi:hypothetical protein
MDLTELTGRAQVGDVEVQLELAGQLDDLGRHEEAIDRLSRAARTGDARALGRLGVRLLAGDRAPALPDAGARLLADAARAGDADAAALTAVLLGGGFHAPQDWRMALDYLGHAAELGSASARAQLQILSGRPAPGASEADGWRRLGAAVDLKAWTSAPMAKTLNDSPRVLSAEGLVPLEACRWIVEQSRSRLVRAEVHDPRTGLTVMGQTRTNRVANFTLAETSLLNLLIQARIGAAMAIPVRMMEAFAVLHYAVGEEASEHFDYLEPSVPAYAAEIAQIGQRIATGLLYLNDDYDGGATDFPALGLSHRGRAGDLLVFFSADAAGVPDPRTLHAGRPPTRGEKWVLSQFVRNRPMAPKGVS